MLVFHIFLGNAIVVRCPNIPNKPWDDTGSKQKTKQKYKNVLKINVFFGDWRMRSPFFSYIFFNFYYFLKILTKLLWAHLNGIRSDLFRGRTPFFMGSAIDPWAKLLLIMSVRLIVKINVFLGLQCIVSPVEHLHVDTFSNILPLVFWKRFLRPVFCGILKCRLKCTLMEPFSWNQLYSNGFISM